jgi:hypothetical protein
MELLLIAAVLQFMLALATAWPVVNTTTAWPVVNTTTVWPVVNTTVRKSYAIIGYRSVSPVRLTTIRTPKVQNTDDEQGEAAQINEYRTLIRVQANGLQTGSGVYLSNGAGDWPGQTNG